MFERPPKHIDLLEFLGKEPLLHKVHAKATGGLDCKEALHGKYVLLLFARYVEGDTLSFDIVHQLRNVSLDRYPGYCIAGRHAIWDACHTGA